MERSYRFRIYPNARQRRVIDATIGCARWVYNEALATRERALGSGGRVPSTCDLMKMIPGWKRERPWLAEADSMALQQAVRDLGRAYDAFFRRVGSGARRGRRNPCGHPRFKSKRTARASYRTNNAGGRAIAVIDGRHVRLPKLGSVRARVSRAPEGRIVSATVRRTPSGRYLVSLCCVDCPEPRMGPGRVGVMGVDAGIHDLMVRSDGARVANPRSLSKAERRLAREQRRLSRRQRGSSNYERQRVRIARLHERVADRRRDAIHKATTDAVRESQAIAVEDLNVAGMARNRRLAKAVADASMGEALRELEYKCDWYGRGFVKVGRFYPSSKTCSHCGHVYKDLTLSQRSWTCPGCGERVDRDLNAAVNIAREGKRILDGTVGLTGTGADAPTLVEQA